MFSYVFPILSLVPLSALAHSSTCPGKLSSSQLQYPICPGPPSVYVVESSQGKGLGVFAAHDLEIGDIVMREAPVLKIQFPRVARGSVYPMDAVSRLVHNEFESLSPRQQEEVLSLTYYTRGANTTEVDKLATIFRTNAYKTGDKVGLFPKIARINHSCRPNTGYTWSERLNKRVVFATRKIKAGEEFSSLTSPWPCLKRTDRSISTSMVLNVNVTPALETKRPAIPAVSPSAGKREALKNAQVSIQLSRLVQEEGLADYYAKAYRIVAITHGRVEDWQSAATWANKAYEIRYMEDPDSSLTNEMAQLTGLYISNWQSQLRYATPSA
ncbi:hypothetical protein P3342_006183 [Pyrenophora teres f. teres]|nr:hypothetical protein P3342_006183 [Pyrenophora teres f. teres]